MHWMIWSNYHRAFWSPNALGYTTDIATAGRWALAQGLALCRRRSVDPSDPRSNPPELLVPSPELVAAMLRPQGGAFRRGSFVPSEMDRFLPGWPGWREQASLIADLRRERDEALERAARAEAALSRLPVRLRSAFVPFVPG